MKVPPALRVPPSAPAEATITARTMACWQLGVVSVTLHVSFFFVQRLKSKLHLIILARRELTLEAEFVVIHGIKVGLYRLSRSQRLFG